MVEFQNKREFAEKLDNNDELSSFRDEYFIPENEGKQLIYFCGNSLGLQPKKVQEHLKVELEDWKKLGLEGHFHGRNPWFHYHKFFSESLAKIIGARPEEVVAMNSLTVNLHLAMVSFYRPKGNRFKIMMEGGAFPSDQYAVESQVRHHGLSPEQSIIELKPREGEHCLRTEDIEARIDEHGEDLALVMLGGINYYTGQLFNMQRIAQKAHEVGAYAGFDLAHAAGNASLKMHDWNVDFAVWCTYKYLNSSPGGVAGMFVHEKHGKNPEIPRFAGWWGYKEEDRFQMTKGFVPEEGAAGWQLSNAPVLQMAAHRAALDLFDKAGMNRLREKSDKLTAYLEFLIRAINKAHQDAFEIITPESTQDRAAQLSILAHRDGKVLFDKLTEAGIVADWREPNVIRVAPAPMYNRYVEVYEFAQILKKALD